MNLKFFCVLKVKRTSLVTLFYFVFTVKDAYGLGMEVVPVTEDRS